VLDGPPHTASVNREPQLMERNRRGATVYMTPSRMAPRGLAAGFAPDHQPGDWTWQPFVDCLHSVRSVKYPPLWSGGRSGGQSPGGIATLMLVSHK
jgi:hypothetical protein